MRSRGLLFSLLVAVCVAGAAAYVALAAGGDDRVATLTHAQPAAPAGADRPLPADLRLIVRARDRLDLRLPGRVYVVDPAHPDRRKEHPVECMRVHVSAGRGLCLSIAPSGVDFRVSLLDRDLTAGTTIPLAGVPSRTRVSPDGRYGAVTTFVTGDSYTTSGEFSTRTLLVDMAAGKMIVDLERFRVLKDGRELDAPDHNFWGVTFAQDSDRFYATLGTGEHHYLVRGSVRDRTLTVLRDGVECPSLSPDGTQIGFKASAGGDKWRFSVLDLETLSEHPLSEQRSIDDQLEWLDDRHVAYGDGRDVWMARADGGGEPERLVRGADSPAAIRG